MSISRFTSDQIEDKAVLSSKLADNISITNLTATNILAGNCNIVSGSSLTKNGSPLSSSNGYIFKYSTVDLMHLDDSGNLYVKGNIDYGGTINSTTTTVNTLEVADYEITLNATVTSAYASGGRLTVYRGTGNAGGDYNPYIAWDETSKYWKSYDGTNTAKLVDLTYGDARYLKLAGGTMAGEINMNNFNITNLNNLTFNDPGPGEGITWSTGNGWAIYESPDDLVTNTSGNFQIVRSSTRVFTLDTSNNMYIAGDITVNGNRVSFGNGSYISNENDTTLNIYGDDSIKLYGTSVTPGGRLQVDNSNVYVVKESENYARIAMTFADGKIGFGPGTTTRDTWIYRDASNSLKTDGALTAVGNITAPQLISNIAIGTAPFTVTSTTKVTNLNVDAVDGCSVNDSGTSTSDLWTASKINTTKISYSDVIMNTNPFGGKQLFINSINNAMFRASERWVVTGNLYNTSGDTLVGAISSSTLSGLFDGNYEGGMSIPAGQYAVININFSTESGSQYPGYPYGWIYVSHYYTSVSQSITGRVYCNYAPQTIGWHDLTFSTYAGSSSNLICRARNDYYAISQIEIRINAPAGTAASITELDWQLDRPGSNDMPLVDKFKANSLYSTLTFKNSTNTTKASISSETGVGTFTSGTFNIATGTAPFTITSTTKVTNLNVDRVDDCSVNDSGTSTSDLWTASKITTMLSGKSATGHDLIGGHSATLATATTAGYFLKATSTTTYGWAQPTKSDVGLGSVENTALSTWVGTGNITTLGTVGTGTWNATVIADGKIASALTGKTYNALTLTSATDGFTIAGGTTSRTLTITGANKSISGTGTGITLTGAYGLTLTMGAATSLTLPTSGTVTALGNSTTGTAGTAIVLATSPSLTTPTLGVASATSINKVAITAPATSATLTIADGKTFTCSNTLTLSGTDSSTLNIGTGGTLGTAAYTATTAYAAASHDHYSTLCLDDRDAKPSDMGTNRFRVLFTSLEGLTGTAGTDYQDLLVLNSYTDSSGGNVNALVFDKSAQLIRHYQAGQTASTWGTPKTLRYIDDTVAIANGGTGQTSAVAAFNALSPSTTLGDIIYHNGTDDVRLVGNTTSTKQFLSQTGTSTVSAAPIWSAVSKSDVGLGSVENTALSTWAGTTNITTAGTLSVTKINKVTITTPATGSTLTIADGKTLTCSNTLTLSGTDSSTLNIGTGGTLGSAAYTASTAYAPTSHATNASTYGYGDGTNAGHVRKGNGITVTTGTLSIVSQAGTAGSIGTINIATDAIGVSLGTTSTTACAGNDSRLSDSRTPTSHATNASTYGYGDATNAGHVRKGNGITVTTGTLSIVSQAGTAGSVGTLNVGTDALGVSLGTTSTTACAGNDSRLSDARTPSTHGDSVHNHQKFARITYTGGTTNIGYQWNHALNSANVIFSVTPNSPETHVYYTVVDNNNVKIYLDDTPYETIILDVMATVPSSLTSATANLTT